jgi:hypothetical protein
MLRTTAEASETANARWRRPDVVDQRVDALAATLERKVDALPPLTGDQFARLAAVLVAAAPPLTDEQRAKLRPLLAPRVPG